MVPVLFVLACGSATGNPGSDEAARVSPSATSARQCPTAAQARYFGDAYTVLAGLSQGADQLTESFGAAAENPLLFTDSTWKFEIALALSLLDAAADSILDWDQPRGIEEIDGLLKAAATDVKSAVGLMPGAINDLDAPRIIHANSLIGSAGQKVTRSISLVTFFCD